MNGELSFPPRTPEQEMYSHLKTKANVSQGEYLQVCAVRRSPDVKALSICFQQKMGLEMHHPSMQSAVEREPWKRTGL